MMGLNFTVWSGLILDECARTIAAGRSKRNYELCHEMMTELDTEGGKVQAADGPCGEADLYNRITFLFPSFIRTSSFSKL